METLGRGRRTWWVVDVLQGDGRPSKDGGERSWPGSEQPEGMERELRRVQMRRGPAFPRNSVILSVFFRSVWMFFLKAGLVLLCSMLIPSGLRGGWGWRNYSTENDLCGERSDLNQPAVFRVSIEHLLHAVWNFPGAGWSPISGHSHFLSLSPGGERRGRGTICLRFLEEEGAGPPS